MEKYFSGRIQSYLRLTFLFFVFHLLYRLCFMVFFWQDHRGAHTTDLWQAFYLGSKFDLRVSLLVSLPFLLLSPWQKISSGIWSRLYAMAFGALLAVYLLDFGYYSYLKDRLNATVLQFAENLAISTQMLWESYPIVSGFLMYLLMTWFVSLLLIKWVFFAEPRPESRSRKMKWITSLALAFLVILGLYGKWAYYPLRWSEAYFSGHRFVAALSINPLHNFFDTITNRQKNFDIDKVRKYYPIVSQHLGVDKLDADKLNFTRIQKPDAPVILKSRPNIVIILMESLSAHRCGIFNNSAGATPNVDEMANKGWSFNNFFTPSEGTARGIFALVTGLTDINKGRTSSRNPLIVDQNTAANFLQGYEKYYFIGGSANWGNIRGFLTNNIVGLKLFEEGMFDSPRTDVWGISDYHLVQEANKRLVQRDKNKPYLAFIQTAGFHRPYSIPDDHGDFKLKTLDEKTLQDQGFLHNEEYNSIRFMDFSLGHYIKLARQDEQFDNTLFVVLGDHGLPDNGAQNLSPTEIKFSTERFHTPLLFYGPKLIQPKKMDMVVGQQDIMPTLASLTNHEFVNKGLGRNIFDPKFKDQDFSMSYVYYRNPHNIFMFGQEYMVTGIPGQIEELYKYKSQEAVENLADQDPTRLQIMGDLLMGLYETSKYLLYHNQKVTPISEGQR